MDSFMVFIGIILVLFTYAILFKLHSRLRKVNMAIEEEATKRKEQDWKLYHFFKSQFLAIMGKKMKVEEKVDAQTFDDLLNEGENK